jgi:hypothetical protein
MWSMDSYSKAAVERAMKVQEVMLRAWAKKISWWRAAEILGISDRHLQRIREGYEKFGYFGGVFGRTIRIESLISNSQGHCAKFPARDRSGREQRLGLPSDQPPS